MQSPSLIIIGSGISGLVAARQLSSTHKITILEANDRIGGRLHTLQPPGFSKPIEAGAEFIHGKAKHSKFLLAEAGIEPIVFWGKMYRREKGAWTAEEEMIEGWDELLKQMKSISHDMTLQEFLDTRFAGEKYANLRRRTIAFAEGFDIADVKRVSVQSLAKEWSSDREEDARLPNGYGELIDFLHRKCIEGGVEIRLNSVVKQIDWEHGSVTVYTENSEKLLADKVIVTVSLNIIQQIATRAAINFTPPIDPQVKAFSNIGMGNVIKAVVEFDKPLWPEDMGFIFSDEIFPTWWRGIPGYENFLTGWCGGSRANRITGNDDEQLKEQAILSLAAIFGITGIELKKHIKAIAIFNWPQSEWACGGYSYRTPETMEALKLLNRPLENAVYFTGEALSAGETPGTVEAAIGHALQTAERVRGQ